MPLLDWEGVISGEAFLNTSNAGKWEHWVKSIQSMPNLTKGLAAVWFWEITFMINLISGVEFQLSMELSSASYCASMVISLKPKSSIHNERVQGMDKSPIMFDYSHRCFTVLLCWHQMSSLKHLILTVGCLSPRLPTRKDQHPMPIKCTQQRNKANHAHASSFFPKLCIVVYC